MTDHDDTTALVAAILTAGWFAQVERLSLELGRSEAAAMVVNQYRDIYLELRKPLEGQ